MPDAVGSALTRVGLSRVGLVANCELKLGYPRPKGSDSRQSGHECLEAFSRQGPEAAPSKLTSRARRLSGDTMGSQARAS